MYQAFRRLETAVQINCGNHRLHRVRQYAGALSAAALCRMDQRRRDVPASGVVSQFLDETYPDSVLKERYPNMGILDEIGW